MAAWGKTANNADPGRGQCIVETGTGMKSAEHQSSWLATLLSF